MSNPFHSDLTCPDCGHTDPSQFTARSRGEELGKDDAIAFLLSEGETHALVQVECDDCGAITARSVTNVER